MRRHNISNKIKLYKNISDKLVLKNEMNKLSYFIPISKNKLKK